MRTLKILFILIALIGVKAHAQTSNYPVFDNGGEKLEKYLSSYFINQKLDRFRTFCNTSCIFARFRIDSKGNVKDIECNRGTSPALDSLIKQAILSTSGKWKQTSNKPKNEYFLLPFIYKFGDRCKQIENTAILSVENMLQFSPEPNKTGKPNIYVPFEAMECKILPAVFLPEFYD